MRIGAVLFVLSLLSLPGSGAEVDPWRYSLSFGGSPERLITTRFLSEFPSGFERNDYPKCIMLTWPYESESRMPSPKEQERIDLFEVVLQRALDTDKQSLLVGDAVGNGRKQWLIYSRTEQTFVAALNASAANEPRFAVELRGATDPEWTVFQRFIQPKSR